MFIVPHMTFKHNTLERAGVLIIITIITFIKIFSLKVGKNTMTSDNIIYINASIKSIDTNNIHIIFNILSRRGDVSYILPFSNSFFRFLFQKN